MIKFFTVNFISIMPMMTTTTIMSMMTDLSSRLESPTSHSFPHHLLHLQYILHFLRGNKFDQSLWQWIKPGHNDIFPTRRFSYSPDSAVDDSFRPSLSSTLPFPRSPSNQTSITKVQLLYLPFPNQTSFPRAAHFGPFSLILVQFTILVISTGL